MIQSKKGVEAFPFFLFLTLLIASVVIIVGFYQVQIFSNFSSEKELVDSYNSLKNAMENLRATADQGSFTRVILKIPAGRTIDFNPQNDTITIKNGETLENTPGFNIIAVTDKYSNVHYANYTFEKGEYELVVYYGNVSTQTEPYEIFFV